MNQILAYILARAKEPSSYAGLAAILGTAATQLVPFPSIAYGFTAGAAICGALAFALKENPNKG